MKGNKLVITFILALIVCLVLIPTCAFAEGTEILSNEASSEIAGNPPAAPAAPADPETPAAPVAPAAPETPAESTVETSDEPSVETSDEPPVETSDEPSVETPDEPSVETPDEPSVETSDEPPVETPDETPDEPPVETPVETPAAPGYTVEFTVGEKQYVLAGDSSVDLSEILGSLGISGEISGASSSADSLFSVAQDENGKWTVSANECFSSTQSMTVVVDGQEYQIVVTDDGFVASYVGADGKPHDSPSLQDAINNAADGTTVVLKKDTVENVSISLNKTVIIDLGGNTLSMATDKAKVNYTFNATDGIITIKNGTISGRLNVYDASNVTLASDLVLNGAVVVWGDVSSDGTKKTPVANIYGTINATATTMETDNYGSVVDTRTSGAISTNGTDRSGAIINIYDGANVITPVDNQAAIFLPSGSLNVYGGIIKGDTGIYAKGGSLNITGGQIIADGEKGEPDTNLNSGYNNTGTAITIEDAYNGTSGGYPQITGINISGGTMTSENADAILYLDRDTDADTHDSFISGGIFSSVPEEELLSGDNTVISAGELYAVGSEGNMASVNALMDNAGDNVITVYSAPNGITAPEGSTVVNKTGSPITVNGVVLQPGQSITIPVSPVAVRGDYYIIEGKDQTWTKGSNEELSFKLNSGKLIKVLIDGEEVEFEITEDGLVTIAPEVLEALEPGVHIITFVYVDGGISTNIVIEA